MKKPLLLLALLLLIPSILAQGVEIQKTDKGSTIVSELSNPAIFDFVITNTGEEANFQIYSLVVPISPGSTINLKPGANTIEVRATPSRELRQNLGFFSFEYEIKKQSSEPFKDTLLLKIVPFKEVFEIEPRPFNIESKTAKIKIKNTQNTNLNAVLFKLSSSFFTAEETLNFKPNEEKEIEVEINKDFSTLKAGPYIVEATITAEDAEVEGQGIIDYLENEGTFFNQETSGLIVRTTTLEKSNLGNTEVTESLTLNKDIISRLFTLNTPSPSETERKGLSTIYTWKETLAPGESIVIESTTNYTLPFMILLAIIIVGFTARFYFSNPLTINKRVSLVKTKGGEFALKVNLRVKAKENLDKVQLTDFLPGMTKLYEKFGKQPDEINEHSRTLTWKINHMSKGEERLFSYVIYSKLKIVGRFELPTAKATFTKDGQASQVNSNHAFFAEEITD